jgi:hypothetical protein
MNNSNKDSQPRQVVGLGQIFREYFSPDWLALFVVTIALELFCSWLAYYTLSQNSVTLLLLGTVFAALTSMLLRVGYVFNVAGIRHASLACILGWFLLIVPYHLNLGVRWAALQHEAARIVSWAYEERLAQGRFPESLDHYTFSDPRLARFFHTFQREGNDFILSYYVGTTSTSHWYRPSQGWCYYPD